MSNFAVNLWLSVNLVSARKLSGDAMAAPFSCSNCSICDYACYLLSPPQPQPPHASPPPPDPLPPSKPSGYSTYEFPPPQPPEQPAQVESPPPPVIQCCQFRAPCFYPNGRYKSPSSLPFLLFIIPLLSFHSLLL